MRKNETIECDFHNGDKALYSKSSNYIFIDSQGEVSVFERLNDETREDYETLKCNSFRVEYCPMCGYRFDKAN